MNFMGPELIVIVITIVLIVLVIRFVILLVKKLMFPSSNIIINNQHQSRPKSSAFSNDTIGQLERLASLKEKGLLSDAEYQREKDKLLNR